MKVSNRYAIAAAVCAALGGTAANAFELTDYAPATKIYFGGATATDNTLEEDFLAINGGICDTNLGRIDIWRSTNERVVTCWVSNERTPGHGFPARGVGGLRIAFHKESQGGSSNGVVPLIAVSKGQAHTLRWLDLAQTAARPDPNPGDPLVDQCGTAVDQAASATLNGFRNHPSCPLDLTAADSPGSAGAAGTFDVHGGISDTEPALSFPAPGAADAARLVSNPGLAIVFGVPATKALYRALQISQFGDTSPCDTNPAAGAFTISDTNPACVPSLTHGQVRALYTGDITSWDLFTDKSGTSLPSATGVAAPTDSEVYVCRRVATSGTQASFESYFLNQRCVDGVRPFVAPDDGSGIVDTTWVPANPANGFVNAAPSSGNVRSCLQTMNGANRWAVGVLSTEVTAANLTAAADSFRFVAIDGAAPTLANVANGDYQFFTENTINRIGTGSGTLADGDARREIVELIDEKLSSPTLLAALNATFAGRPWGNGGILALNAAGIGANTAPYSDAELATRPVSTQSRFANSCVPPIMVSPSPGNGSPNP